MFPICVPAGFRIIAHRGASGYAPENTVAAFDLARQMGATEVETDVRLTRDGVVVLCHDGPLERFGYPDLQVEASGFAELRALDLGSWFSPHLYAGETIVSLPELLARHGEAFTYHVEFKGLTPELVDATHAVVGSAGLGSRCVFTSFDLAPLTRLRELDPRARLGWLVGQIDADTCDRAAPLGLFQLCPSAAGLDAAAVERARAVVPEVRAWGLGGSGPQVADAVRRVLAAGGHGATIDRPDWLTHG
jgi:glycerophosphoryl diester phosphodiesterase